MGNKKRKESKSAARAGAAPSPAAPQLPGEAQEALRLYEQFHCTRDDACKKSLADLLASRPSSAAYLASAKVLLGSDLVEAVQEGLESLRGQTGRQLREAEDRIEAKLLHLLDTALEWACTGALKFKSLQCLRLGVHLLRVTAGRGPPDVKVRRMQFTQKLSKLMELWTALEARDSWAKPDHESVAKLRWPFEAARDLSGYKLTLYQEAIALLADIEGLEMTAEALANERVNGEIAGRVTGDVVTEARTPILERLPHFKPWPEDTRAWLAKALGFKIWVSPDEAEQVPAGRQPRERARGKEPEELLEEQRRAEQQLRRQATREWLLHVLQSAGDDLTEQRAALLGCLRLSVNEVQPLLQPAEWASIQETWTMAEEGLPSVYYCWPTAEQIGAVTTEREFKLSCLEGKFYEHQDKAWESLLEKIPPLKELQDHLDKQQAIASVMPTQREWIGGEFSLVEPTCVCAADMEYLSALTCPPVVLGTEAYMQCGLWRAATALSPSEREGSEFLGKYFRQQKIIGDQLDVVFSINGSWPPAGEVYEGGDFNDWALATVRGQLLLQAFSKLQQRPDEASTLATELGRLADCGLIDVILTPDVLPNGISKAFEGDPIALQRIMGVLQACAVYWERLHELGKLCDGPDSNELPNNLAVLAPLALALLPSPMARSGAPMNADELGNTKEEVAQLVLLGLGHLIKRQRLSAAAFQSVLRFIESVIPPPPGTVPASVPSFKWFLQHLLELPLGALLEVYVAVSYMWGAAFISMRDVDESLLACCQSSESKWVDVAPEEVWITEAGLAKLLEVHSIESNLEGQTLDGLQIANAVEAFFFPSVEASTDNIEDLQQQDNALSATEKWLASAKQLHALSILISRVASLMHTWRSKCQRKLHALHDLKAELLTGSKTQAAEELEDVFTSLFEYTAARNEMAHMIDVIEKSLITLAVNQEYRVLSEKSASYAKKDQTAGRNSFTKDEIMEWNAVRKQHLETLSSLTDMRESCNVLLHEMGRAYEKRELVGREGLKVLGQEQMETFVSLVSDGSIAQQVVDKVDIATANCSELESAFRALYEDACAFSGRAQIDSEIALGYAVESCMVIPRTRLLEQALINILPARWEQLLRELKEEKANQLASDLMMGEDAERKAEVQSATLKKKGAKKGAKKASGSSKAASKTPKRQGSTEASPEGEQMGGGEAKLDAGDDGSATSEQLSGYARMLEMLDSAEEVARPQRRPYSPDLRGTGKSSRQAALAPARPAAPAPARQAAPAAAWQAAPPRGDASLVVDFAALAVADQPEPSREEEELQAALRESVELEERLAQYREAQAVAEQAEAASPAAPGLANATGEYNCFLNAIVQCLWHCAEFREEITSWPAQVSAGDPVVAAFRSLFHSFAKREREQALPPWQPQRGGQQPSALDPTALREALSALPGQLFRVGEMSDAGEVLLAIYDRIKGVTASRGLPAIVDHVFGLHVGEAVHCSACGAATHESSYVQYLYNAQATALRTGAVVVGRVGMGRLLRWVEAQQEKSCDTDIGGCGVRNPVNHFLQRTPRVFTMQLAWESAAAPPEDIRDTMAAVDEQVDLADVYHALDPGQHVYGLRSMVCYYGAHYFAFVRPQAAGRWLLFDDASVSSVGGWADVVGKCRLGRIQPSVLFYDRQPS